MSEFTPSGRRSQEAMREQEFEEAEIAMERQAQIRLRNEPGPVGDLKTRISKFINELTGAAHSPSGYPRRSLQASEVADRLAAELSPAGYRLPPFSWTESQRRTLRRHSCARVHWVNAAPSWAYVSDIVEVAGAPERTIITFSNHAFVVGFDRIDPSEVRNVG